MASSRSGEHACIERAAGEVDVEGSMYNNNVHHGAVMVKVQDRIPNFSV